MCLLALESQRTGSCLTREKPEGDSDRAERGGSVGWGKGTMFSVLEVAPQGQPAWG